VTLLKGPAHVRRTILDKGINTLSMPIRPLRSPVVCAVKLPSNTP